MDQIYVVLGEVCIYLPLSEITQEVSLVCKEWKELLSTDQYIHYWIKSKYSLGPDFPINELINLHKSTQKNSILNFSAFKTDAGCSSEEYLNSFKNMFEYTPIPYSTYYSFTQKPLNKNLNCLAVFSGHYKENNKFFDYFNNDLFALNNKNPPKKLKIKNFDQVKSLTIDPLNVKTFGSYKEFEFPDQVWVEFIEQPKKFINYDVKPALSKAFVTKIAIARPMYYTGPVRNLVVLASKVFEDRDFSIFYEFDDVVDLEAAKLIGSVRKVTLNDNVEIVEYNESSGYYPLVWVRFKNPGFNHIEYELSQARQVLAVNVKLLDIDDRRMDWGLPMFEPNFDITYTLMLGHEIP